MGVSIAFCLNNADLTGWADTQERCGLATDSNALIATPRDPSVPFLNPTGQLKPDAISRWVCDSVVRAPIADQEIRSCMAEV